MSKLARLTLAFTLLAAGSVSMASAQGTKINVGYATATDFLPAFIGKEQGCFAKNDLDVTMTRVQIVSNIPAALISGSLQIGMSTPTVLLQAVDGGLELVTVAGAARMLKDNPTVSLIVRNGVEVKTATDLKGKKIGVPGINSVVDVMLRKWLKNNGVKLDDVTFIEIPFPQMNDLLKAGTLDAVAAAEPIRSRIVGAGTGYRIAEEYYTAVDPDSVLTFWMSSSQWAKANPDAIKKFRTCLTEGLAFIKQNPEKAREIEKQYLGFNTPVLPTMTVDVKPRDFTFFVALSKEMGLIRNEIDVTTLVAP